MWEHLLKRLSQGIEPLPQATCRFEARECRREVYRGVNSLWLCCDFTMQVSIAISQVLDCVLQFLTFRLTFFEEASPLKLWDVVMVVGVVVVSVVVDTGVSVNGVLDDLQIGFTTMVIHTSLCGDGLHLR